jgi:hypothetical protein
MLAEGHFPSHSGSAFRRQLDDEAQASRIRNDVEYLPEVLIRQHQFIGNVRARQVRCLPQRTGKMARVRELREPKSGGW